MKKLASSKTKHNSILQNSKKYPSKTLFNSNKTILKKNYQYINSSSIPIKPINFPSTYKPNIDNNTISNIKNNGYSILPISLIDTHKNWHKKNLQTPTSTSTKSFCSKNKFSNSKSKSSEAKVNSFYDTNDTIAFKENINLNYGDMNTDITKSNSGIQKDIRFESIPKKKLGQFSQEKLATYPGNIETFPTIPLSFDSDYLNIESLWTKPHTDLLFHEEKTTDFSEKSLKAKLMSQKYSIFDLNIPRYPINDTTKKLSIGSYEKLNDKRNIEALKNNKIMKYAYKNIDNKHQSTNSLIVTYQSKYHDNSKANNLNSLSEKNYGNSENRFNENATSKEKCCNHPHKKAKYTKINLKDGRELSPSKYCSKCAIFLVGQGLKMKEIIVSDSGLRKAEVEEFLICLATAKRKITKSRDSLMHKKQKIITFYLKQAEKAEFLYNTIHKVLIEEKTKSLDVLNSSKDNILNVMQKYEKESEYILQDVNNIQTDIEKNIENIIKNIALEPFQDIINRYKQKVQIYDTFINEIKNNSIILTKLPTLKKGTLEIIRPMIISLYENIEVETSLLKHEKIKSDDYINNIHNPKDSQEILNYKKSSLCISFDNKEIFENAIGTASKNLTEFILDSLSSQSNNEQNSFSDVKKSKNSKIYDEYCKKINPDMLGINDESIFNKKIKGAMTSQIKHELKFNNEITNQDFNYLDKYYIKYNINRQSYLKSPKGVDISSSINESDLKIEDKLNLEYNDIKLKNKKMDNSPKTKSIKSISLRHKKSFLSFEITDDEYYSPSKYLYNENKKTTKFIPCTKIINTSCLLDDLESDSNKKSNHVGNNTEDCKHINYLVATQSYQDIYSRIKKKYMNKLSKIKGNQIKNDLFCSHIMKSPINYQKTRQQENINEYESDKKIMTESIYHYPSPRSFNLFAYDEEYTSSGTKKKHNLNNFSADAKLEGFNMPKKFIGYDNAFLIQNDIINKDKINQNQNDSYYQKSLFCSPNFKENLKVGSPIQLIQ